MSLSPEQYIYRLEKAEMEELKDSIKRNPAPVPLAPIQNKPILDKFLPNTTVHYFDHDGSVDNLRPQVSRLTATFVITAAMVLGFGGTALLFKAGDSLCYSESLLGRIIGATLIYPGALAWLALIINLARVALTRPFK